MCIGTSVESNILICGLKGFAGESLEITCRKTSPVGSALYHNIQISFTLHLKFALRSPISQMLLLASLGMGGKSYLSTHWSD
mmetsp:Transcript_32066/g.96091  ORF Transcript_32066/g.96091 Transcript_32066/m.96091 type:complete len:82 (+) Transcript_32066:614-859(+)